MLADASTFAPPTGNRGFTDQEAIADLGLVNMNGRIYDPVVGRFLSADPNVQFASNLQSYNRYSYASGNPLRYTDPTGYFTFEQGFMTSLGLVLGAVDVAVCATGAGCLAVMGMNAAVLTTTSVVMFNQPVPGAIAIGAVGFASGFAFGALGAGAAAGMGMSGPLAQVVGGAISGAASAAFMTLITGGNLGTNILEGAALGALGGALSAAVQANAVSQAEAEAESPAVQEGAHLATLQGPRHPDRQKQRSKSSFCEKLDTTLLPHPRLPRHSIRAPKEGFRHCVRSSSRPRGIIFCNCGSGESMLALATDAVRTPSRRLSMPTGSPDSAWQRPEPALMR